MWKPTIPWGFLDWHSLYVTFHLFALSQSTIVNELVSVWCFIWIFVRHSFSLYLRIEALLLSYFSQFYDHLETLLLNLHNFLSTKKWNLFFKQLGSQLTQIFRRKSKQDSNYCCPHRAATYFCLEGVWGLHLWGSLFRSLQVCFAILPVPSPRRVAPNAAKWNV